MQAETNTFLCWISDAQPRNPAKIELSRFSENRAGTRSWHTKIKINIINFFDTQRRSLSLGLARVSTGAGHRCVCLLDPQTCSISEALCPDPQLKVLLPSGIPTFHCPSPLKPFSR